MLRFTSALVAAGTLVLSALLPAPATAENVLEACSAELQGSCGDVVPGNGRLYSCLYANEEKLSDGCSDAVADVHDQMDLLFELVRYTKQECLVDIEKLCTSVELGGGRLYSCLKQNEADLTPECGEVITRLSLPED